MLSFYFVQINNKHKEEIDMKTFKNMLNVASCWCLFLSLCRFAIAEDTNEMANEKPNETQVLLEQKIAKTKEALANTPMPFEKNEQKAKLLEKANTSKEILASTPIRFEKNENKSKLVEKIAKSRENLASPISFEKNKEKAELLQKLETLNGMTR